jgi:hypothetical protein
MSQRAIRLTGHELGRLCRGRNPTGNLRRVRVEVLHKHSPVRRRRSERTSVYALTLECCLFAVQNAFMLSDTVLVERHGAKMTWGLAWSTYVSVKFTLLFIASANFPKWHETPHLVKLCSCAGNVCQVEQRQCSLFKKQVLRDNAT